MFATFPKRKGFSEKNAERRDCVGNGNHALKEVGNNVSNDGVNRNGGQTVLERASPTESLNSNTSNISRTRPRRKRRRRRRRPKKSQEEIQSPTDELKFQVRRKRGRRRRKRKRKVHVKENVMCLESSGSASTPPLSSNSFGSQTSSLQSCNDSSQVSQMEYENLPWANLKMPMDLSLVDLEVNGDGVDFDLQAQENHQRWLANLEKAGEKDICLDNTSQ